MTPIAAIAQSGLVAATLKLTTSAANIANADDRSRMGARGYQPLRTVQAASPTGGVTAQAVTLKPGTAVIYDPTSSLANVRGFVQAPEIDPISEVSNMIAAGQAFAFQVKVLKVADKEQKSLLDVKA
ncbi:MAG TPA: flagellar basal body rod C-terminal domain-containing protein [Caulobacteraceae bacterium]|nr:flagellar basal body rod C-terminal domain-containing protein [Caulobacteraceae bacterium]